MFLHFFAKFEDVVLNLDTVLDFYSLFQILRCCSFSESYPSRGISVCLFTHFSPYVVHIEISETSYNLELREYP
jgi:hypothetical protein